MYIPFMWNSAFSMPCAWQQEVLRESSKMRRMNVVLPPSNVTTEVTLRQIREDFDDLPTTGSARVRLGGRRLTAPAGHRTGGEPEKSRGVERRPPPGGGVRCRFIGGLGRRPTWARQVWVFLNTGKFLHGDTCHLSSSLCLPVSLSLYYTKPVTCHIVSVARLYGQILRFLSNLS